LKVLFALTSVDFSVTCLAYEFYFIHLSWEKRLLLYIVRSFVRRKLQQWAQGCVYSHMHDVIEYRSNACACMCLRTREKKPLLLNVYARGITVRQARRTFDIIDIHKKQLSFVFIFFYMFDSFNHLSSTTMKLTWS